MLEDILQELFLPDDPLSITQDIQLADVSDLSLDVPKREGKDIFSSHQRSSWDKSVEARCDFQYRLRLTRRASTNFISIWQKSIVGRTLTDIKADDDMVPFFVENLTPVIRECVGYHLHDGSWAIVTTPMRRHMMRQGLCEANAENQDSMLSRCQSSRTVYTGRNFATLIAEGLAAELAIPFYFDCAHCHSKQRVGAVFSPNNIPREPNVIVFDDFVTTGSTLLAMKNLLQEHGKNCVFFTGINNKL